MTATPPDPLAKQHDGTPDPEDQGPVDTQNLRLREENRALRELLAAQVHASLPRHDPGWFQRLCWWIISAPGAALVEWRSLLGRDDGTPITRRSVGCATLTVLYTLAIYGALVLLVVSWSSPNASRTGATAAGPVRVPLEPPLPLPSDRDADAIAPASVQEAPKATPVLGAESTESAEPAAKEPIEAASTEPAAPQSTLRVTEIPAPDPMAWVQSLEGELAHCADLGFFERPNCAWAARTRYCEPNKGWGVVKECPAHP